ncbi:MAG: alkaline phosphatase family protein [Chthonomonadales bacterium]
MRGRWVWRGFLGTAAVAVLGLARMPAACPDVPAGDRPAGFIMQNGAVAGAVLPNGRMVKPWGRTVLAGNFPLGIAVTPKGDQVLVVNCGAGTQSLMVLDGRSLAVLSETQVKTVFNGIAVSADASRVWVCGGGANNVQVFHLEQGRLSPAGEIPVGGYPASCALSPDGRRLYVVCNLARCVRVVDTDRGAVAGEIATGFLPFGIALTPDGRKAYVTNWGDGSVSVLDLTASKPLAALEVGGLPCGIVASPDGRRVYVADANTDDVAVIRTDADAVAARIPLSPYPGAPYGTVPNGLVLLPGSNALYVTLAGINAVARIDIRTLKITGMLPTAWYPTGIAGDAATGTLYVVSSKGFGSGPNKEGGHISRMMRGTVQRLAVPQLARWRAGAAEVARLNGFSNRHGPSKSAGLPKGIKHVVFIVRENRSYDQVLGDLGYGNGDPSLTVFGEEVTPNLHALARRFALADNMYGDGEVSVQGHQWTLGANCPDYVEKTWQALYSHRGRLGDAIPGPQSYPVVGYMMDECARLGVSCRMYGDFVRREKGGKPIPLLADKVAPSFPGWNLSIPDQKRADAWLAEFRAGIFPAFSYIWLPNDHTAGASAGMPTPRAMVADNDLATGRILEALSHHREWRDTVVFLTEDDTQDGRDHVDAHRNILLIMSPWVRPGSVSSHHYSIASIYATIEALLGLPPMSQYDDLADPIRGVWQAEPNLQPYTAVPSRVPLDERNPDKTALAKLSEELDLSEPDANTGPLLEEILWREAAARRNGR